VSFVRRVIRIAAYRPRPFIDGAAAPSLDEDEFTLAAAATERAWSGEREEPGPVEAHLLGEFPAVADWGFSALLGRPTEVVRHRAEASELARTLETIEQGVGGAALLVVAELPRSSPKRTTRSATRPVGAVAFRFAATEEADPLTVPKMAASRSAFATALKIGASAQEFPTSVVLAGNWEDEGEAGLAARENSPRESVEVDPTAVSEGAYIPRPRYLENLPSRWRFLAEVCEACHGTTFPARGVCRRCGRRDALTTASLPFDGGRVVAVTTVGKGGQPTEFDAQVETQGPYDVALVELARGMRVTLQVTDAPAGTLEVGDRVNTLLRRLYPMEGEWRYGRKAVPAGSRSTSRPPGWADSGGGGHGSPTQLS